MQLADVTNCGDDLACETSERQVMPTVNRSTDIAWCDKNHIAKNSSSSVDDGGWKLSTRNREIHQNKVRNIIISNTIITKHIATIYVVEDVIPHIRIQTNITKSEY